MSRSRARASRYELFGPPHNWCDGACARCVLNDDCALARRLRGSRWVYGALDEEPDGWDAVLADLDRTLLKSLDALKNLARGEQLQELEPPPEAPRSLYAERLRRAGVEYSLAFSSLLASACGKGDEAALAASSAALRVGPKIARLSAMLLSDGTARFDPLATGDAHANLMLVEELDRSCATALPQLFPPDPAIVGNALMARGRLFALLAPLWRQIPRSARRVLARLIAEGAAPSPFFVTNVVPLTALTKRVRTR